MRAAHIKVVVSMCVCVLCIYADNVCDGNDDYIFCASAETIVRACTFNMIFKENVRV